MASSLASGKKLQILKTNSGRDYGNMKHLWLHHSLTSAKRPEQEFAKAHSFIFQGQCHKSKLVTILATHLSPRQAIILPLHPAPYVAWIESHGGKDSRDKGQENWSIEACHNECRSAVKAEKRLLTVTMTVKDELSRK